MRFPGTVWARIWHDLEGIGSLGLTVPADAGGRLLNVCRHAGIAPKRRQCPIADSALLDVVWVGPRRISILISAEDSRPADAHLLLALRVGVCHTRLSGATGAAVLRTPMSAGVTRRETAACERCNVPGTPAGF